MTPISALERALRRAARSLIAACFAVLFSTDLASAQATLVGTRCVAPLTLELTVHSQALARDVGVRIVLPRDYAAQSSTSWPVLYLLHGSDPGNDEPVANHRLWTDKWAAAQTGARRNVLIVMPEGGDIGFYSDWLDPPANDAQKWETFHIRELLPWVEQIFRTNGQRAIAGLSMGGFGSFHYALRNPGTFLAAAAYSGVLDTVGYGGVVQSGLALSGYRTQALWGDGLWDAPVGTRNTVWKEHNPAQQTARLLDIPLYLWAGDGSADTSVDPNPIWPADPLEVAANGAAKNFENAYRAALGTRPSKLQAYYSAGQHRWPFWKRELDRSFAMLADAVHASVPTTPAAGDCLGLAPY